MRNLIHQPYKPIWATIPFIFLFAIIGWNYSIDIPLHDTYYIITVVQISAVISVILFIIGIIDWFFRERKLITWMTAFHVSSTIALCILVMIINTTLLYFPQINSRIWYAIKQILNFLVLAAMLGQILFIVNLVLGLVRKK